jgi:multiple antibiotic resistance protein
MQLQVGSPRSLRTPLVREIVTFSLVSLSAVFFVVDPIAAIPVFLAMTRSDTTEKRRSMALRASIATFAILTVFSLAGAAIFRTLGISVGAFKVAGGVLLLLMSIDMLRTKASPARITQGEVDEGTQKDDIAIVPLAMPLLAGPGSIATVVVLVGRARTGQGHWWQVAAILGAILVTSVASYLMLRAASRIDRVLGQTGMSILSRVAGLLLAAIAIQFMLDGIRDSLPALMQHR